MRVVLCGVRGSVPAPGAPFVRVGGNTSCVALVRRGEQVPTLVLDAGTGLRGVTQLLGGAPFAGTILLGHLHWDHTFGLPFFAGGDRAGARTRVVLPEQGVPAVDLLRRSMSPPAFPIAPEELRGDWSFDAIDEGEHELEGFRVLAREIPHKGGRTFGYRITDGAGTLAYLSDHGPLGALGPGPDGWGPYHEAAAALCDGADVLLHDAQHRASELAERAEYGHSAAEYAVALARRCGVPRVLLFHHDPGRTDDAVEAIVAELSDPAGPLVQAACEGHVLELGPAA